MPSTLEETGKHTVQLTVEVPAEDFKRDLDKTYRKVSQSIKVPGVRKGHVRRKVIDAQVGPGAVLQEFLEDAVPLYYGEAVREHELAPIADPDIEIEQADEGQALVFSASVEVRPRLTLTNYKGVQIEAPDVEVTDKDVETYVEGLRERFAELEVVGGAAGMGDYV